MVIAWTRFVKGQSPMSRDVHWFLRDSVSHVACRLHFPTTGQHRHCHVCSKAGRAALGRLSGRQIWHNSASLQPVHLGQLVRYLVSMQCWSRSGQSLTESALIWQHPPRALIPRYRIACVCVLGWTPYSRGMWVPSTSLARWTCIQESRRL